MGYVLWPYSTSFKMDDEVSRNAKHVFPNGYLLATPLRGIDGPVFTVEALRFWDTTPFNCIARTPDGHDAVIRVMATGDDGREQLNIWRDLATAPHALLSSNHTLPLWREIDIGNITLGVFPRVAECMDIAYSRGSQNSVGDILDMIMQALEGLAFIHSLRIAHRDAFKSNFVVQFFPESLKAGTVPVYKPRVYLIDFEAAIRFPEGCPPCERVCTGLPLAGSLLEAELYTRKMIPEMQNNEPYDPFKLDVWQLGQSFVDFNSTLEPVEEVLNCMAEMDPAERLTAGEALSRLRAYVESVPPKSLLIPPVVYQL